MGIAAKLRKDCNCIVAYFKGKLKSELFNLLLYLEVEEREWALGVMLNWILCACLLRSKGVLIAIDCNFKLKICK